MQVVHTYFSAFNRGDIDAMVACLTDDVAHHVNEGGVRVGQDAFRTFCLHMNASYKENLTDIVVLMSPDGVRVAAEYVVNGTYLMTDTGLPEARGQTYCLPAGSFFDVAQGKIARVTTYYNLSEWIRQVSS